MKQKKKISLFKKIFDIRYWAYDFIKITGGLPTLLILRLKFHYLKGKKQKDLYIENAISTEIRDQLRAMEYYLIPYGSGEIDLYFGGVQGIKFNNDGSMHGGADPRRDGKALGY